MVAVMAVAVVVYNEEACTICLAFLLVVQPRKIAFNASSLKSGERSKEALIAAGLAVGIEMDPPAPWTYRYRFLNDVTPRDVPSPYPRPCLAPVVPDDERAVELLRRLPGPWGGLRHDPVAAVAVAWVGRELLPGDAPQLDVAPRVF